MDFGQSISHCLKNYATFSGRASRSEFWWFFLFSFLVNAAGSILGDVASALVSLALLLPGLAVGARRLHDIGKSGWFQLLWFIPLIGWGLLLYWAVRPSADGANAYGEGPAGAASTGSALSPGQQ